MLICRAWFTAKVGVLHRKAKQPVLKTGLKSSVQSQAERKSDAFGERPEKAHVFWGLRQTDLAASGGANSQRSLNRSKMACEARLPQNTLGHLPGGIHRVHMTSLRISHLPKVKNSSQKKAQVKIYIYIYLCYLYILATRL